MAYKYENQTKIKINIIKLNLNRTLYIKAYGITQKNICIYILMPILSE